MSGTGARVLTAVVLIPIVLAIVGGPAWLTAAAVAVVIVLSLREFFTIGEKAGFYGFPKWCMFCAMFMVLLQYDAALHDWPDQFIPPHIFGIEIPLEFGLIVFVMGAGVLTLFARRRVDETLKSIGITASGMLFVAFPLSYLVRLRGAFGGNYLLLVLVIVWAGDSAAFLAGRVWGKHLLAPTISPKKTWEGAVGNLAGSLLILVVLMIAGFAVYGEKLFNSGELLAHILFFGFPLVVSLAGQLGDLVESAFKRSAGVKDSGTLLPGHGGMLDRIDAFILAAPAAWAYLTFVLR